MVTDAFYYRSNMSLFQEPTTPVCKIKKELKFKSRFRDGGYIILVEKPNKQGNSQSTAHPQHHPIPKLLHATCTVDTQGKIKAIVEMRKRLATCSPRTDAVASYLNVQITADMYKELSR